MEHYAKGENVEHDEVVVPSLANILPEEHTWIKVRPNSKIRNLIGPTMSAVSKTGLVLITGSGPATSKAVSCAEVVKKRSKSIYQRTEFTSRIVEEFWEPKREDLERLKVTREIPCIQILLSKTSFEGSVEQTKSSKEQFLNLANSGSKRHPKNKKQNQYQSTKKDQKPNTQSKRRPQKNSFKENKNDSNSNSPQEN